MLEHRLPVRVEEDRRGYEDTISGLGACGLDRRRLSVLGLFLHRAGTHDGHVPADFRRVISSLDHGLVRHQLKTDRILVLEAEVVVPEPLLVELDAPETVSPARHTADHDLRLVDLAQIGRPRLALHSLQDLREGRRRDVDLRNRVEGLSGRVDDHLARASVAHQIARHAARAPPERLDRLSPRRSVRLAHLCLEDRIMNVAVEYLLAVVAALFPRIAVTPQIRMSRRMRRLSLRESRDPIGRDLLRGSSRRNFRTDDLITPRQRRDGPVRVLRPLAIALEFCRESRHKSPLSRWNVGQRRRRRLRRLLDLLVHRLDGVQHPDGLVGRFTVIRPDRHRRGLVAARVHELALRSLHRLAHLASRILSRLTRDSSHGRARNRRGRLRRRRQLLLEVLPKPAEID